MLDIIAPQVHPDRDAFLLKDLLELPGGIGLLPSALTAADDRLPAAVEVHIGVIGGEVGHIVHGGVLVDHLVHVIAKAVFCGVDAAEGQTTIEKIGEPQVEVDGMGRAQAAAKGDHAGEAVPAVALLGDILDLGHNFLHDIADPLLIAADPPVGVAVGVGPGLLIDGVDGDDHDLPGFDPRSQRTGHVEVLKVEETAILTGDKEHGAACVAVDLAFHLPAQCGAVILEVLCFHVVPSSIKNLSGAPRLSYQERWHPEGMTERFSPTRTSKYGTRTAAAFPSWLRCGCRRAPGGWSGGCPGP